MNHTQRLKDSWAAAALILGMLVLGGCSRDKAQSGVQAASRTKGMPVPVTVAQVIQKDMPVILPAIGTVRAYASVAVKSRVDGQLAQAVFKSGDEVKKGDLIFQIDPRPMQAALSQAEAVVARDQASLENAEADMRRTDELANTKAVAAATVDVNRAKAAALRATVAADRAAIESAKLQLSYCSIASPVNGRLGILPVDEGNMVKNNDTILATISQTRPIYVDFAVAEQWLPQVRDAIGHGSVPVEAVVPQNEKGRAVGKLEVINNEVDSQTGTILLRAVFANEDEMLWPGQFVNVALTLKHLPDAVVIPSQAVQNSQNGPFIFVVKGDSTVEKRPVTIGPAKEAETVVENGIKSGETVVTDGQLRLTPGAKISVKMAATAQAADGRKAE